MSTSDKLTYLSGTKDKLKTTINYTGANITNDTFRSYPEKLYNKYIDIINNGTGTLYSNMPKVNGQGSSLILNNTESAPMLLSLYGDTQQDSTTGKQLFNYKDQYDVNQLYTIDNDGWISVTYNNTGSSTVFLNYYTHNLNLQTSTNYVVMLEVKSVSGNASIYTSTIHSSSQSNTTVYRYFSDLTNGDIYKDNITTVSDFSGTTSGIRSYLRFGAGQSGSITFRLSVLANTSITPETFKYEPYTGGSPAPNPTYPFDIHNVSGDNTIEICGKNLIDLSNMLIAGGWTDTTFVPTSSNYITLQYIRVRPSTKYTLSTNLSSTKYNAIRVVDFNSNKNIIRRNAAINLSTLNTFTTSNDTYYIAICFYTGQTATTSDLTQAQLELGETSSEYEAYTGNSQLISLGVENLLDISDITTGNGITNNDNKSITLNGNFTSTSFTLTTPFTLKANTTYTLSITNTNNSYSQSTFILRNGSTNKHLINYNVSSVQFTPTQDEVIDTLRLYNGGATFDNFTFSVQLEKGSKANSYSEYGKPYIELNKISTYQDYIYKDNDRWYLHKEIGKWLFDNNSGWSYNSANTIFLNNASVVSGKYLVQSAYCNYYKNVINENITGNSQANSILNNNEFSFRVGTQDRMYIKDTRFTSIEDFNTWLSTHNLIVYYVLATPTDTEITDTTLLEQLNNLEQIKSKKNQTNINQENNDLPFIITASALKEYE